MKEHTYGWYPPAKSIWDRSKELSSYHKECLYKHWSSRYNDQSGVSTPVTPSPIRALHPPKTSRPSSRSSLRQTPPPCPPEISGLSITGSRATSIPMYQAHSEPGDVISVDHCPVPTTSRHNQRASRNEAVNRRSQSAMSYRPRSTPPPRPTKSAGPIRSPVDDAPSKEIQSTSQIKDGGQMEGYEGKTSCQLPSPPASVAETCHSIPRPGAPVPESEEEQEGEEEEGSVDESQTDEDKLDYEEQLEKYGWRFEIPGDPLNLKRPTLPPRLPYTVKVPVPKVAPNPPTGHMMNYDTYFYNTIPKKPMSFTIHQEWISEVLHAKRMDLQKKEGTNYNYKQYAFIY